MDFRRTAMHHRSISQLLGSIGGFPKGICITISPPSQWLIGVRYCLAIIFFMNYYQLITIPLSKVDTDDRFLVKENPSMGGSGRGTQSARETAQCPS